MNSYINQQINNIITMAKVFEQSCKMAALKDDGQMDKTEEKTLKRISAATQHFIKELEKIK